MKVVINKSYGGFSLSEKAIRRYAEIKGLTLYPERTDFMNFNTWWTAPPEARAGILIGKAWNNASLEDRITSNQRSNELVLYDRNIPRDDAALVQVVEELGSESGRAHAQLRVVEIPDDVEWEIDEYDGLETINEKHRSWG